MEIIPLDRGDDAVVATLFEVCARNEAASRVQPVRSTAAEFATMIRYQWPGEHDDAAVAVVDGAAVGLARIFFAERDNRDKCQADVQVDPAFRGRGVGSALLDWVEQRGRAEGGRSMVLGEVFIPVGERESHRSLELMRRRGYRVASVEIVRSLPLPVDADVLRREGRRAGTAAGEQYEITVHVGGVPHELRQGLCDCSNRVALDAPTGEVEFEAESETVEDYQTTLDHFTDLGFTLVTALAVHRASGVVAAYSGLTVPASDPDIVFQWGTLVLPEHRGNRLGMAVKVANLECLATIAAGRTSVRTMNDEQNPWMVNINADLGFVIIEEALSVRKDL